jgi:hypothetical protein
MAFIFAFPRFDLFACQERKIHTRNARTLMRSSPVRFRLNLNAWREQFGRFFPREWEDISTGSAPPIDGDFRPAAWLGFPNVRHLKTEKGVFLNGTRVV